MPWICEMSENRKSRMKKVFERRSRPKSSSAFTVCSLVMTHHTTSRGS